MNVIKKINCFSKTIFSLALACGILASLNVAHAGSQPVDKEAAGVDKISLEVEQIKTLEEAQGELENTNKTISSYNSTLRQVYRGTYSEDPKEIEEFAASTKALIRDLYRKADLLKAKINTLEESE